jgi:indolepyruvate ferredoxin oxidoreductase beta subunit
MKNILIAGVGGQGTLLASVVLGGISMELGYDVKLSEVHGMAQRGGNVVTYVRIGDKGETVYSPIIEKGDADILLAFEQLEALRWVPCLKKNAAVYASTQKILPMPVITGAAEYPADVPERIKAHFPNAVFADALAMANEAGSGKAVNMVLIGVMAGRMEIDRTLWRKVIGETVKPAFREINERAFGLGYDFSKGDR